MTSCWASDKSWLLIPKHCAGGSLLCPGLIMCSIQALILSGILSSLPPWLLSVFFQNTIRVKFFACFAYPAKMRVPWENHLCPSVLTCVESRVAQTGYSGISLRMSSLSQGDLNTGYMDLSCLQNTTTSTTNSNIFILCAILAAAHRSPSSSSPAQPDPHELCQMNTLVCVSPILTRGFHCGFFLSLLINCA